MKLYISTRGTHADHTLREHIRQRMAFTLSRFGSRVRQLRVRLTDLNGPRGAIDKQCRLEATLDHFGVVTAEVTDSEERAAVNRAMLRLARRIAHVLERTQALSRRAS